MYTPSHTFIINLYSIDISIYYSFYVYNYENIELFYYSLTLLSILSILYTFYLVICFYCFSLGYECDCFILCILLFLLNNELFPADDWHLFFILLFILFVFYLLLFFLIWSYYGNILWPVSIYNLYFIFLSYAFILLFVSLFCDYSILLFYPIIYMNISLYCFKFIFNCHYKLKIIYHLSFLFYT